MKRAFRESVCQSNFSLWQLHNCCRDGEWKSRRLQIRWPYPNHQFDCFFLLASYGWFLFRRELRTPSSSSWNNAIFVTLMRLWFFPFLVGLPLEVMLWSVLCSNPHRHLPPSGGGFLAQMFCIQVVIISGVCLKDMMLSVWDVLTSTPSYVGVSSSPLWA